MNRLSLARRSLPSSLPGCGCVSRAPTSRRAIASIPARCHPSRWPPSFCAAAALRSRASCDPRARSPHSMDLAPRSSALQSAYTTHLGPSVLVNSASKLRQPRYRTTNHQQSRPCSYRRNMCRAQALEGSASVDVSAAREVLPDNVKAAHYHLTLEPNLETFEYTGEVTIE
jgi:hypothetical protein